MISKRSEVLYQLESTGIRVDGFDPKSLNVLILKKKRNFFFFWPLTDQFRLKKNPYFISGKTVINGFRKCR